jgi:hypothetical protein
MSKRRDFLQHVKILNNAKLFDLSLPFSIQPSAHRKYIAHALLTADHSKNLENHIHMVSLYAVWYKYARYNSAVKVAPAITVGLSMTLGDTADIVRLENEHEQSIAT